MGVGWLRGLALVLAVLAGGVAGTAAWDLVDRQGAGEGTDPLDLGVELVNQPCSTDSLLVLARGSTRPSLRAAAVDYADDAKYLETAASCPTLYAPLDQEVPEYVVYLGPFSSPGNACEVKMTPPHQGDYVTSLRAGNQTYVKCPCELSVAGFPVLTPGAGLPDAVEGMWIRQLQGMLVDLGRLTEDEQETGLYDADTVAAVKRIQFYANLPTTGVVDAETWGLIRDRACRLYDY